MVLKRFLNIQQINQRTKLLLVLHAYKNFLQKNLPFNCIFKTSNSVTKHQEKYLEGIKGKRTKLTSPFMLHTCNPGKFHLIVIALENKNLKYPA